MGIGGAPEDGDIGLGIGATDGGVVEGGDGGAMEGGEGGDVGGMDEGGVGGAMEGGDIGGINEGGVGERPGGAWSAACTTSFSLAQQLASLPLMKKKGPGRSSVNTVQPPWNLAR